MPFIDLEAAAVSVAPRLLGSVLRVGEVAIRLTEVEAYAGESDPASHAWRGPTPRTQVMFGPPGHLYVYLSHGVHHCVNVVCGRSGEAAAVLLRGAEVVSGHEAARRRHRVSDDAALARGPGNIGAVLDLTRADSGLPLDGRRAELTAAAPIPADQIRRGPRVGVSRAADRPWRFWIAGDPTVSAYRRAIRRGDT